MRYAAGALLLVCACALPSPGVAKRRTRVIAYRDGEPAFLQWDSDEPLGWRLPNDDPAWAAKIMGSRMMGYFNGSLYFVGGSWSHYGRFEKTVKRVSLWDGTVSDAADMIHERMWPTVTGYGYVLVCGGRRRPEDGTAAESAEDAWPSASSCEVLGSQHGWEYIGLPYGTCGLAAAAAPSGQALGDRFAVAGGLCANGSGSDQVHTVDLRTGRFARLPSMNKPRWAHSMAAVGNMVVVCGGEVDDDRDSWKCEKLAMLPQPAASWEYLPDMPMNAGASEKPAAYARQVVAIDTDTIMVVMSDGGVLFWSEDGGWQYGPGLPYSGDQVALAVIEGDDEP